MTKRCDTFARRDRDYYPTPELAAHPLLRFLHSGTRFAEPMAGDGALVGHLEAAGHRCVQASDIAPKGPGIHLIDVFEWKAGPDTDLIITNPPWDRRILHPVIEHLADQRPTWLLFDVDWAHTMQSAPLLPRLRRIVSVGRVKWFPDTKHTGKDNAAWHLFDRPSATETTRFYGRIPRAAA